MSRRRAIRGATALAALAAMPGAARAGRRCEARAPDVDAFERGLELAGSTARALDASGARLVVLARAGQDLTRWGQRWSHLGFARRDPAAGAWRVLHKLNACGADTASLWRQGLGPFFLDDPFEYVAGWVEPVATLRDRLDAILSDADAATRLHEPAYSMVAHPWSRRYQQSNQWVAETIAAALEPAATTRERAQWVLRLRDYRPAVLRIDTMTRLGARLGGAHVSFDDHPDADRFAGRIATTTADSVLDWLTRTGLAGPLRVVR